MSSLLIRPFSPFRRRTSPRRPWLRLESLEERAVPTVILSTFNSDTDGWTANAGGIGQFAASGGNPGGFFRITDNAGDPNFAAVAPPKFLGNLSGFNSGTLSIDVKILSFIPGKPSDEDFGRTVISSPAGTASLDVVPQAFPANWATFSVPLTATAWGQTATNWAAILSNVTSITINLEGYSDLDVSGLDNVRLESPANTAPTLAITGPTTTVAGQPNTFTFTTTDNSTTGTFTYAITWGDGTTQTVPAGKTLALNHTYSAPGNYTISATVTDPDGAPSAPATLAVNVQPATVPTDDLVLTGTTGPDVILVFSTGPTSVTAIVNGVTTSHTGVSRVIVHALGGDDVVTANPTFLPVFLNGGEGNDVLFGGVVGDVLSGGPGNDTLYGLGGNDILIGGTGSDVLFGGSSDDLLVAGTTSFDADQTAVTALLREWSSQRPYADRVANLRGDSTSPTFNQRLNGNAFLRVTEGTRTVFDDQAGDSLSGDAGRDWYFAGTTGTAADIVWMLEENELLDRL